MSLPAAYSDPDKIADAIIARVGKSIVLALPLGLGKANHIANAIYARAAADSSIKLRIFTALTLGRPHPKVDLERRFIDPLSDRLFKGYPELDYAKAQIARKLPPNIEVDEFFFLAGTRLGNPFAQQTYISANYTHAMRYLLERKVNVVAQLVAKRSDPRGDRYSLSCNSDITLDLLAARKTGDASFVMAGQVNSELPFMPGDSDLGADNFEFMLESSSCDFPLFTPPTEPVTLTEYAAGLQAARLVPDGGTLQLGIGAMGDAVAQGLVLRNNDNAALLEALTRLDAGGPPPPPDTFSSPFMTGVHGVSEMFVEGFIALMRAGVLKREVDGILMHAGFFVGSGAFNRALRDMPERDRAKLHMTAISFVNELYGGEEAKRRARVKARFINNTMMATLLGAVISDTIEGGQVVSGVGGQYNFVAHAFALPDARSILMLRSTRSGGGRTTSNVLWEYGHTTIPRHLRDIVITEYGIADLRGKSDRDCIAAMLAVTDSRFQHGLLRRAKDGGKIERAYELPRQAHDNTPDRLTRALSPLRDAGHLPLFPLGTDFTDVEQRLLPALGLLRNSSKLDLLRLAISGVTAAKTMQMQECLQRMDFLQPATLADHISALVLRGALGQTLPAQ
ncbi:MAG: acetyl-CoA hydrolase/transferase C-terminal domain-containing protein [Xanthobacteraceae bacterium]